MAQYIHFEAAVPPVANWTHLSIEAVVNVSADLVVLRNTDGTETRLTSSAGDFAFDAATDSLTGSVNEMKRTNSGGTIVYEEITGLSVAATAMYAAHVGTMIETALAGDDVITGWSGPDMFIRNSGNDVVEGGRGADYMDMGMGDDTYILRAGDGGTSEAPDRIAELAGWGFDTIRIIGLSPANVRLLTTPNGVDTGIRLALTAPDGSVTYTDLPGAPIGGVNAGNIERVVFDDGTVWDLTGGLTIVGTDGNDAMWGTPFGDTYSGAGGADWITAGHGDDLVSGGTGGDTIQGDLGNDTLKGDEGDDVLLGGDGDDLLDGGLGTDVEVGGAGDDTYILRAGEGGSRDNPEHFGEDLKEGDDPGEGPVGDQGMDTVRIIGASPDDVRIIGAAVERPGELTFAIKAANGSFTYFNAIAATDDTGSDIGQRLERVVFDDGTVWDLTQGLPATGTDVDDAMVGTPNADRLAGRGGSDALRGYGGDDTLDGGVGNDDMRGGLGDDTYVLRAGDGSSTLGNLIEEDRGAGIDTIRIVGLGPDDIRILGSESTGLSIALKNAAGSFSSSYLYADGGYGNGAGSDIGQRIERVVFDDGTVWDLTGALSLKGTDDGDWLAGTPLGDTLAGLGGGDIIRGFDGNDTLKGGAGDDLVEGGRGSDILEGGDGIDMLKGGVGDDRMSGGAHDDAMFGGDGNDWLSGGAGSDILDGGLGVDTMSGGAGDDFYRVDSVADIVVEGRDGGIDEVRSSVSFSLGRYVENLLLEGQVNGTGNAFGNSIIGSGEANVLNGMIGLDRLEGGGGDDTLTGGRDCDTFVFKAGFGQDTITDFAPSGAWSASGPSHDIIEFDRTLFANATDVYAHCSNYLDDVKITTDAGDTLLIENVSREMLQAHPEDFHFV